MPRQEAFRYTSLCRFFVAGRCERGEDCLFAHHESQLREKPDLFRTRICRSFSKSGECKEGPSCRYAHSEVEVRSSDGGSEVGAAEDARAAKHEGVWARHDSSWSTLGGMEDSNDSDPRTSTPTQGDTMGSSAYMQWMPQGNMAFCPMPMGWSPNGFGSYQVMWLPSGDMAWMPCPWQDPQAQTQTATPTNVGTTEVAKEASSRRQQLPWDPINAEPNSTDTGRAPRLLWDPIGQASLDASQPAAGLAGLTGGLGLGWDPLGLGAASASSEDAGSSPAVIDPSVVLLAARTLDKTASLSGNDFAQKRARFYSLPSTSTTCSDHSNEALCDDEADDVFEAWAVGATDKDIQRPDDSIMHKGVHYEMTIRNTFISFGVSGTAKRMLHRSRSEPSLSDRDD